MRYVIVLIGLLAVIGCRNNQMSFDPFSTSGPALMPPPSTGTAGRSNPYYKPASNAPPSGSYGVASPGQATAPPQLARFTSDDPATQTAVADVRASYTTDPAAAVPAAGVPPVAGATPAAAPWTPTPAANPQPQAAPFTPSPPAGISPSVPGNAMPLSATP